MSIFNVVILSVLASGGGQPEVDLTQPAAPEVEIRASATADSPETVAENARSRAQQMRSRAIELRRLGAVAYKTGLIRDAEWKAAMWEAEARAAEESIRNRSGHGPTDPEAERYLRRAASFRRMGGSAYKLGLVAWAESEARRRGAILPGTILLQPSDATASSLLRPWGSGKPVEVFLEQIRQASLKRER